MYSYKVNVLINIHKYICSCSSDGEQGIGTTIYLVARGGPFLYLKTRKMNLDPEGSVPLQSVNLRQYLIRKKLVFWTNDVFTSSILHHNHYLY